MAKKMKMMVFSVLAFTLIVLHVVANTEHADGMACDEAVGTLAPCQPFLIQGTANPSVPCCMAVKIVNSAAATQEDRKALCECFKKVAPEMGVKPEKAKQLPDLCSVKVPVPIDPNVDCNKIGG